MAGDVQHERRVIYDRDRARRLIRLLTRCASYEVAVQASRIRDEDDDPYCHVRKTRGLLQVLISAHDFVRRSALR